MIEDASSLSLLARAREGDHEALEILVARYLPRMRRWASGRLPPWARGLCDTDDVVQEALLATVRSLDQFDAKHDAALTVYLRQAVHSRLLNEIRRARRRPPGLELEAMSSEPAVASFDDRFLQQDQYERMLARLSAADREAIVGRLEMQYSYRELAKAWGKASPDGARKVVERALLRLAALMSADAS